MTWYSLIHLADGEIARGLPVKFARVSRNATEALAWLAEFDARRLYLPAAHPSMHSYCVHEMNMEPEPAFKLIRVARTVWKFPAIFPELAAEHLHHSSVIILAPRLTSENVDELLAAARHKTRIEIEQLLAQRFPGVTCQAMATSVGAAEQAPGPVKLTCAQQAPGPVEASGQLALVANDELFAQQAPGPVEMCARRQPGPHELWRTIGESNYDKLRYAQSLASHRTAGRDVEELLGQALDLLVHELERRKFGATERPRRKATRSGARTEYAYENRRYIPRHVKRSVWQRDHGQCTFTSDTGKRCPARSLLEFDHIDPVARGGEPTVAGMRLRCRSHNQYTAECEFGVEFMKRKRELAREATAQKRAQAAAAGEQKRAAAAESKARATNPEYDVVPWLRRLGFRLDEARRAAVHSEPLRDASLKERVRVALAYLGSNTGVASRRASTSSTNLRSSPSPSGSHQFARATPAAPSDTATSAVPSRDADADGAPGTNTSAGRITTNTAMAPPI